MPEVTVEIGGRSYRLGCGEGEERHLTRLAARIDSEVATLSASGNLPEGRLMLMAALMLADRLNETEQEADAAGRRAAEAERQVARAGTMAPAREGEIAASLDMLAARLDRLAGQIAGDA